MKVIKRLTGLMKCDKDSVQSSQSFTCFTFTNARWRGSQGCALKLLMNLKHSCNKIDINHKHSSVNIRSWVWGNENIESTTSQKVEWARVMNGQPMPMGCTYLVFTSFILYRAHIGDNSYFSKMPQLRVYWQAMETRVSKPENTKLCCVQTKPYTCQEGQGIARW